MTQERKDNFLLSGHLASQTAPMGVGKADGGVVILAEASRTPHNSQTTMKYLNKISQWLVSW
jgi:hypothetical protein